MAETQVMQEFEYEAKEALTEGLKAHGIHAEVTSEEAVRGTKRRFWITSSDFKDYNQAERQDIVWRILKERFPRLEDRVKVTMVLTLTPDEMEGKFE